MAPGRRPRPSLEAAKLYTKPSPELLVVERVDKQLGDQGVPVVIGVDAVGK